MTLVKVTQPARPSLVDEMFRSFFDGPALSASDSWRPAMDTKELDGGYEISFSVPGCKKDDIDVSFNNGTLIVTADRMEEKVENGQYHQREIAYGSFKRSLYLPDNVDPDKIDASYTDGILKVSLTKKEEALPKEIPIKVK